VQAGPLTSLCRTTIWRHLESGNEYLALAFTSGAMVVLDKRRGGYLLQVLAAWFVPGGQWPIGAYPGPTGVVLFDGDVPQEVNGDLPF